MATEAAVAASAVPNVLAKGRSRWKIGTVDMPRPPATKTTPVEVLLAALRAAPSTAARVVSDATEGKEGKAVLLALSGDSRFGPPLRAAIRDSKVLGDAPWLVQFLGGLRFAPAVPELLTVWRLRDERVSYQAGQALLAIGRRTALEAMAADVGSTRGTATGVALDAVRALGVKDAFSRLSPLVERGHTNASSIFYWLADEGNPCATDPRWRPLALQAFRDGERGMKDAARELLTKTLSMKELDALLSVGTKKSRARGSTGARSREAALTRARALVAKLVTALPKSGWTRATRKNVRQLADLEKLVGPLPPLVRAFYESVGGIDLVAKRPRDRFVVYSLAEAQKDARTWARTYKPTSAPAELLPPFLFPVAPDGHTKAGYSGGPPIGFEMPTDEEDPVLANVRGKPKFGVFVRRACR